MQIIAKQRDDELRTTFVEDVALYNREMIVFIDETGGILSVDMDIV